MTRSNRSPEFGAWNRMIYRCGHRGTGDPHYTEKGIQVCDEWLGPNGYDRFYSHIGPMPHPKMVVDRLKNDKGYEPGNVRWATYFESNANRSDNVHISIWGEEKIVAEWCRIYDIPRWLVEKRIRLGWSYEEAILTTKKRGLTRIL